MTCMRSLLRARTNVRVLVPWIVAAAVVVVTCDARAGGDARTAPATSATVTRTYARAPRRTLPRAGGGVDSALAAAARAPDRPAAEDLTPSRDRITDESLRSDLCVFDGWKARLEALEDLQPPRSLYHRTKALGWLEFARRLYLADDRSGAVESALERATDLIRRMEAGNTNLGWASPPLSGSDRVRPALWELGDRLHFDTGFRCVEAEVAKLEMELVYAEYARVREDSCEAGKHLQAADVLADYVSSRVQACRPRPKPTAAEIRRQIELLPKFVHFALDSSRVVPASARVLDRIAGVLKAYPQISVQIEGHADRRGTVPYNLALSRRRAQSVREHLLEAGVEPARLETFSVGKARPRVAGDDVQAFARNRCVIFHYRAIENLDVETVPQEDDLQVEAERRPPR